MASLGSFQHAQQELAHYLRDPETRKPPAIEQRRLDVYSGLIYNNIETFISGGFPILRRLYADDEWVQLVRGFIRDHKSRSPYFLEISQEFLQYIGGERETLPEDPPFLQELAHYEWVELALDVSELDCQEMDVDPAGDVVSGVPVLSPLAWSLQYRFPVHHIGPEYRPTEPPEQPTFLVVYRDRSDAVEFMESNSVTARLLELIGENTGATGTQILAQISRELGREGDASVLEFGKELLVRLADLDILLGTRTAAVAAS